MFAEVKEICLKVEEKHIGKIFKLIVKHNGCPELLDLLQALIKVCGCLSDLIVTAFHHFVFQVEDIDLPLKQNQTVIVKYFNLNREKFCDSFLGKDSKKEEERYYISPFNSITIRWLRGYTLPYFIGDYFY